MEDFMSGPGFQILLLLLLVTIAAFFMLTQQRTLQKIAPGNREMSPGKVWLQLIPVFGLVWQFFVVTKISRSIQRQLAYVPDDSVLGITEAVALQKNSEPTFAIGIVYCILISAGIVLNLFLSAAQIAGLFSLSGMICWIIYWVQLSRYKRQLSASALI